MLDPSDCKNTPADPAANLSGDEIVARIRATDGVIATSPTPITIGADTGRWIDVRLAPSWTATCPNSDGLPTLALLGINRGTPEYFHRITGSERLRIILMDVGGETSPTLIVIDSADPARFDELVAGAMPIIESFKFQWPAPERDGATPPPPG
jgi:hypothetical protein